MSSEAQSITLYSSEQCPFAQRTRIALDEAGAKYKEVEIDLQNKPTWYAPKINPASKVPAIVYGGTPAPHDDPSSDSFKLAESLITVEFVADLFPESGLLPKDPIGRAKARFFIDVVGNKFLPAFFGFAFRGTESYEVLLKAADTIQDLLEEEGPYALGKEFTIADVSIAPFLGRLDLQLRENIGGFATEDGKKVYEELQGERYKKLKAYADVLLSRPSFKKTFPAPLLIEQGKVRYANVKKSSVVAAAA